MDSARNVFLQSKAAYPVPYHKYPENGVFLIVSIYVGDDGTDDAMRFFSALQPANLQYCAFIVNGSGRPEIQQFDNLMQEKQLACSSRLMKRDDLPEAGCVYWPDESIEALTPNTSISQDQAPVNDTGFSSSGTPFYGDKVIAIVLGEPDTVIQQEISLVRENGGLVMGTGAFPETETGQAAIDYILPAEVFPSFLSYYTLYTHAPLGLDAERTLLFDLLSSLSPGDDSVQVDCMLPGVRQMMSNQIAALSIKNVPAYIAYVRHMPEEAARLQERLQTYLPVFTVEDDNWMYLRQRLTDYLQSKKAGDSIRIWVPGCGNGEDAYLVSMLVYEILGEQVTDYSIRIFASDVDDDQIVQARKGVYPASAVAALSESIRNRYFTYVGGCYEVIKPVRSIILFSKHNITSNPPFVRLDMISCRGLAAIQEMPLQGQLLSLFQYALVEGGLLFTGYNFPENFVRYGFERLHPSYSVFNKLAEVKEVRKAAVKDTPVADLLQQHFMAAYSHPFVVINKVGDIVHQQGDLVPFLELQPGEMALLSITRAFLQVELRAVLNACIDRRQKITGHVLESELLPGRHGVQVVATPLSKDDLILVSFVTVPVNQVIWEQTAIPVTAVLTERAQLHTLEKKLQQTESQLHTFIERLEKANKELRILNVELQQANEELQTANEELEAGNEELQSNNEETVAAYNELRGLYRLLEEKEVQVSSHYHKFRMVLENSGQAYYLIDQNLQLLTFNREAYLISEKIDRKQLRVGNSIMHYIAPQWSKAFLISFQLALEGQRVSREISVLSVEGERRWFRIEYAPVKGVQGIDSILVSMTDLTREKAINTQLKNSKASLRSIIENFDGYVWSMDRDRRYIAFNQLLKEKVKEVLDEDIEPGSPVQGLLETLDPSQTSTWEKLYVYGFQGTAQRLIHKFYMGGEQVYFELSINPIREKEEIIGLSCFARDITEDIRRKEQVAIVEVRSKALVENSIDMVMLINSAGQIAYASPALQKTFRNFDLTQHREKALDLFHEHDRDTMYNAYKQALQKPSIPVRLTARMRNVHGDYLFIEGTITNMFHIKEVQALVFNFRDVSELIQLQQALTEEKVNNQKAITKATLDTQESERAVIGKELHDNVNQLLSTAKIYLHASLDHPDPEREEFIKQSAEHINTSIEEIRRLSKSLVPHSISDLGLKESISDLAAAIQAAQDMDIWLDMSRFTEERLSKELKINIYRIIQEQVNNVLKHAAASSVRIILKEQQGHLVLMIEDNGKGFDLQKKRKGIGLTNIANRADIYHGTVEIRTAPGEGCCLTIHFPPSALYQTVAS